MASIRKIGSELRKIILAADRVVCRRACRSPEDQASANRGSAMLLMARIVMLVKTEMRTNALYIPTSASGTCDARISVPAQDISNCMIVVVNIGPAVARNC